MLNRGPNDIMQLPSDAMEKIWPERSEWSYPVETFIAFIWITMVASTPFIVMGLEGKPITRTQITLFGIMWVTFFGGVYLFTNVLCLPQHLQSRLELVMASFTSMPRWGHSGKGSSTFLLDSIDSI